MLDSLNGVTYDNFCIDTLDYNDDAKEDNAATVAMICDTCSDEDPCVSICSNSRFNDKDNNENDFPSFPCLAWDKMILKHLSKFLNKIYYVFLTWRKYWKQNLLYIRMGQLN